MTIALPPFTPHRGLPHVKQRDVLLSAVLGWLGGTLIWVVMHCAMLRNVDFMLTDPISSVLSPPPALMAVSVCSCVPDWLCLRPDLSVGDCVTGCGCRYFGDQIKDVFTHEDFQLYR